MAEGSRARATPRLCPSGEGGRRQGESGGGLGRAGPVVAPGKWLEELGQVGFSLSFLIIFYYFFSSVLI